MRSLIWRYISAMHRRFDDSVVTEDDINEVKSDISTMRYEMLEVFEKNGMDISSAAKKEKAHLGKRMKVWERRLMKDFHVALVPGEEEEEKEPSTERGIVRFRRIAQQVVHQTSSHKWHEAVRGVTDTQIGRCRNRESFRNQQNLQRAMEEAKRLVSRSPAVSRTCSPVEFYDPTTSTLLELLKNITEEVGELSPQNTINTTGSDDRSRQLTQQLHELFVTKSPSALSPSVLQKRDPASAMQVERKQCQSISSTLSQQSNDEMDRKTHSPSPSIASTHSSKSPEPKHQKFITPNASQSLSGEDVNACIQSPPPLIQVTRTESSKSNERPKSLKSRVDDNEMSKVNASSPTCTKPIAQAAARTGPTKVVKRKAPAPSTSFEPTNNIAISRPTAMKVDPKQGMIPPPPINGKKDTNSSNNAETSFSTQPRRISLTPRSTSPALPSPATPRKQSPALTTIQQNDLSIPTVAVLTDSITVESPKNVLQIKEPSLRTDAVASPPPLHPQRRVTEVTTIKRQPKTGWL